MSLDEGLMYTELELKKSKNIESVVFDGTSSENLHGAVEVLMKSCREQSLATGNCKVFDSEYRELCKRIDKLLSQQNEVFL